MPSCGLIRILHTLIPSLLCIFFCATAHAQDFSQAARQSDFKVFCDRFPQYYAWTDRPAKPWLTWGTRYAPAVDGATTPTEYAAVIEAALDELHDFHAEVRSPNPHRWLPVPTFADIWAQFEDGEAVVTAVRRGSDARRAGVAVGDTIVQIGGEPLESRIAERLTPAVDNHDPKAREWALLSLLTGRADEARSITLRSSDGRTRTVNLAINRQFDRPPGPLIASVLPGNLGLIRFNNSLGDQATVGAFDAALVKLRSTRGLIIDLRDVPSGGDSSVALGIMGRFAMRMLPYQHHRIPHYGQTDVERNWVELVAPRGPFPYTAPVVVLVDHWTGSMGEGLAVGFDAMHRALVLGTPMAGLAGAVSDFVLPKTGIDIAIATEQIYTVGGTPRQDRKPPILITETNTAKDEILLRGETELRRLIAERKSAPH